MLSYDDVAYKADKFLALTGYTIPEFQALLPVFEAEFLAYVATHTLAGKPRRQRAYSSYRNSPLPTAADKLLFILVYLKQNTIQEMHATLFGMNQSDANNWIHLLQPLLNQALATLGAMPARTPEAFAPAAEPTLIFFQDGTERPITRPTEPEAQRTYYSGKQKQHTLKNLVVINLQARILALSPTCEGKKHDKKLADEAADTWPDGSVLFQDTGFQGFGPAGVIIIQPQKKPRGQELSAVDKANNQAISALRIRVEHAIGGVKRYRIVKDTIRNWKQGFRDQVMATCCALHNFRLQFRPWHYESLTA